LQPVDRVIRTAHLPTALFHLGVAALFTHEMDAVMFHEWRGLAVLGSFPDATAYPIFLAAHFPVFAAILWLSHHPTRTVRDRTRIVLSAFLLVHAALHARASGDPHYEFHGLLSNLLIYVAAAFGTAYVWLVLRARRVRDAS
jgi:hypothetical protein